MGDTRQAKSIRNPVASYTNPSDGNLLYIDHRMKGILYCGWNDPEW